MNALEAGSRNFLRSGGGRRGVLCRGGRILRNLGTGPRKRVRRFQKKVACDFTGELEGVNRLERRSANFWESFEKRFGLLAHVDTSEGPAIIRGPFKPNLVTQCVKVTTHIELLTCSNGEKFPFVINVLRGDCALQMNADTLVDEARLAR